MSANKAAPETLVLYVNALLINVFAVMYNQITYSALKNAYAFAVKSDIL